MLKNLPGHCLERHKFEMITSRNMIAKLLSRSFRMILYVLSSTGMVYAVGDTPRSAGIRTTLVCHLADIGSQPRSQDQIGYITHRSPFLESLESELDNSLNLQSWNTKLSPDQRCVVCVDQCRLHRRSHYSAGCFGIF